MPQIEKSSPQPPRTSHPTKIPTEIPPELPTSPGAGPRTKKARRAAFRGDLSASAVVFLLAVPLSLGIALATGAPSRPDWSPRSSAASSPACWAAPRSR